MATQLVVARKVANGLGEKANTEHRMACEQGREALMHAIECGRLLAEAKGQLKHGEWLPWLEDSFEASQQTAWGYMQLYAKREQLANYKGACNLTITGGLKLLAKPHVAQAAGENEWYTPAAYIESAKAVMGGIDLDPASTAVANEVVGAKHYFALGDNGIDRKWKGRVWLNPPYAQPWVSRFAAKLVEHIKSGDVPMALVLVNNATETAWFQAMLGVATAVCFPTGRVKFWAVDRIAAPLQGQAVIAIGVDRKRFCEIFRRHGLCLVTQ